MVGYSLAAYGVCAAIAQAMVLAWMIKRYGVEKTAIIGMFIAILTLGYLSVIYQAWLVFLGMPITALSAIVGPALQGMMADQVNDEEQGELQGVFASVISISAIISPLLMTFIFQQFTKQNAPVYLPGAPFAAAALLSALALLTFYISRGERRLISAK